MSQRFLVVGNREVVGRPLLLVTEPDDLAAQLLKQRIQLDTNKIAIEDLLDYAFNPKLFDSGKL